MSPTKPQSDHKQERFTWRALSGIPTVGRFTFGSMIILGMFGFSMSISVYHLWVHDAPLLPTILGQLSLLVLSLVFGLVGYYTHTNAEAASERNTIGVYAGAGYGLAGTTSGGYSLHQYLTPEAALAFDVILFQATFVALVGGTAGIFIGFEKVQRERVVADLEAATHELETMQATIRTEKQRFESLFQNSPSAIVDIQYSAGEPTVERANAAFETLLDQTNADVEGKNLFTVVPLQELAMEETVVAHIKKNEVYEEEVTVDQSGERNHYKLRVVPYEVGKEGERAFALYTDVTELRNTQEKLKESVEQLEESNDRLQQFAHAVSHDLQEPLRMVSSYVELLDRRYGDELDDDAAEFMEFAVDGTDRMREMIDGLLEYSRVQTEGEPFEPIDLETVLDDVLDDLQVKIEESDADITADTLPRVNGDGNQLRQVFQNLLENAIEYSGNKPPRVQIGAEHDGDEWVISASDEGVGIDPDQTDRIFEVFQRLHTQDEQPGTGLGLAMCQRIVEHHGGAIWAESDPGEGTTFFFTLPDSASQE